MPCVIKWAAWSEWFFSSCSWCWFGCGEDGWPSTSRLWRVQSLDESSFHHCVRPVPKQPLVLMMTDDPSDVCERRCRLLLLSHSSTSSSSCSTFLSTSPNLHDCVAGDSHGWGQTAPFFGCVNSFIMSVCGLSRTFLKVGERWLTIFDWLTSCVSTSFCILFYQELLVILIMYDTVLLLLNLYLYRYKYFLYLFSDFPLWYCSSINVCAVL